MSGGFDSDQFGNPIFSSHPEAPRAATHYRRSGCRETEVAEGVSGGRWTGEAAEGVSGGRWTGEAAEWDEAKESPRLIRWFPNDPE